MGTPKIDHLPDLPAPGVQCDSQKMYRLHHIAQEDKAVTKIQAYYIFRDLIRIWHIYFA